MADTQWELPLAQQTIPASQGFIVGDIASGNYISYDPLVGVVIAGSSMIPVAPSGIVAAGGSIDSGLHSYVVTFVTAYGETMPSPSSAQVTTDGSNGTVNLTVPIGYTGVTSRNIYRTLAGDTGLYYYVGAIADNVTTSYTDTMSDGSAGPNTPPTQNIPGFTLNSQTGVISAAGGAVTMGPGGLTISAGVGIGPSGSPKNILKLGNTKLYHYAHIGIGAASDVYWEIPRGASGSAAIYFQFWDATFSVMSAAFVMNGITGDFTLGGQLKSSLADGTMPFYVTSTTMSTNLNADLLDGHHWADVPASVSAANPTATVGLAAVNGSAGTFMRSDAAPPIDKTIFNNVNIYDSSSPLTLSSSYQDISGVTVTFTPTVNEYAIIWVAGKWQHSGSSGTISFQIVVNGSAVLTFTTETWPATSSPYAVPLFYKQSCTSGVAYTIKVQAKYASMGGTVTAQMMVWRIAQ